MSRVRRAFLMSSFEQYLALLINFGMMATLARLLDPGMIGIAVVGMGLSAAIFSLREFVTPDFLIQRETVTQDDIRTAFTVVIAFSIILATALFLAAPLLARFYGEPGLTPFLGVALTAALVETSALPSIALMRRDMTFGIIAQIRVSSSVMTALVTVSLAWLGHGYMCYAWGMLVGSMTTVALVFVTRPEPKNCLPSLAIWRDIVEFGRFRGATSFAEKAYETIPQLLLGRMMPMASVAFYNRANAICGIPDRFILSSVFAVAFPALAEQVREGHDVKASYLRLLSYISVVYWPALVVLAITADAVVRIILGEDWTQVVPLVRILSIAGIFWFPVIPTNPLLLAMGKNRDAFVASLLARSVAATILCSASLFGIVAMAASQFLALPFQMAVALCFARKYVAFTWRELIDAIWPSAIVTLCAGAGPLAVVAGDGVERLSLAGFCLSGVLAATGGVTGLVLTGHPFLAEVTGLLRAPSSFMRRPRSPAAPAE
jgi:O-antigen/teichoic acid export membrane protein